MTTGFFKRIAQTWRAPFFSPQGFINRAIGLTAIFAVCHLAGLREYTSFISGTSPTGDQLDTFMTVLGCAYFVFYSLLVLVVPVFILAAIIFRIAWNFPGV